MPPAKSKNTHDDAKSETASVKERNGHAIASHRSNGKLQRVASSSGSQLRDTVAAATALTTVPPEAPVTIAPGLQWSSFDRDVLHSYRREYRLDTPTAFSRSYHALVLSRPGIGMQSPTMARRLEYRRQNKEELAQVVRKHFNGLGIQENDAIVGFLHRVRTQGVTKPKRSVRTPHSLAMP